MIFMAEFGLLMEYSCLLFFVNPERVDSKDSADRDIRPTAY
ncbi:unnamed protein product, partial [marine sediment metagenome]